MPAANQSDKPIVLGITGTIASGKSMVGRLLADRGIPVIDTDQLTHDVLENDISTKKAIVEQFGIEVLTNDKIDRKKLGKIVFGDETSRRKLEQIVHPNVVLNCRRRIEEFKGEKVVAVLVPLLFEAGVAEEYDVIWTVFTSEEVLQKRLEARDKLDAAEISQRLAAQLPQSEKCKRADQVIDNSFTEIETARQVDLLLSKLV